jgi:hypothetical protein
MGKGLIAILLLVTSFASTSQACDSHGITGIVEENSLYIPVGLKTGGGITEGQFNDTLDRVAKIYEPIIKSMGAKLTIQRAWSDGTVNAYATRSGRTWIIKMFGGLARHKVVTQDGFAVVACHEIGHHIAGAPKRAGWFGWSDWASNEGQSDYWGTAKCLRKYMEQDDNVALMANNNKVTDYATRQCEAAFTNPEEIAMCQRAALAGESLANLFRALRNSSTPLSFDTPDKAVVKKTDDSHPASQCRMDTYFQGALCDKDHTDASDQKDPKGGFCNRVDGYDIGIRPLCWYKP